MGLLGLWRWLCGGVGFVSALSHLGGGLILEWVLSMGVFLNGGELLGSCLWLKFCGLFFFFFFFPGGGGSGWRCWSILMDFVVGC